MLSYRNVAHALVRAASTLVSTPGVGKNTSSYFRIEVTLRHDGEPIAPEHRGLARLTVPRLYAWKSAKWVAGVELLERDRAGFWEKNGYHMRGDPCAEERYNFR